MKISTLKGLIAKKEIVTIEGIDFELQSLTYPEIVEFAELTESKRNMEAYDMILFRTLRAGVPTKEEDPEEGADDEDIKQIMRNLDGFVSMQIIKKVSELSGLSNEEEVKKKLLGDQGKSS